MLKIWISILVVVQSRNFNLFIDENGACASVFLKVF